MFIGLGLFVLVSGCSKTPRTNPCKLLSINEVQALDDTVARTEWYPPGKRDMNELCTYNDGNNERRIMLFFWKDKSLDPLDKIKSAMQGGDTRVVEIEGVGETAAAGFEGDVLKLKLMGTDLFLNQQNKSVPFNRPLLVFGLKRRLQRFQEPGILLRRAHGDAQAVVQRWIGAVKVLDQDALPLQSLEHFRPGF
jgi:hypothetical protein